MTAAAGESGTDPAPSHHSLEEEWRLPVGDPSHQRESDHPPRRWVPSSCPPRRNGPGMVGRICAWEQYWEHCWKMRMSKRQEGACYHTRSSGPSEEQGMHQQHCSLQCRSCLRRNHQSTPWSEEGATIQSRIHRVRRAHRSIHHSLGSFSAAAAVEIALGSRPGPPYRHPPTKAPVLALHASSVAADRHAAATVVHQANLVGPVALVAAEVAAVAA
mmetsp:Transcript_14927/g.43094  ORF Transcript_14927/g.43094 Transcript_14927/m.43094 type:complete len:216 (-) Transcript_14927:542-1189(-)